MGVALAVVGSLVAVVGIVALIARGASRTATSGAEAIPRINDMLKHVGDELGLSFHADGAEHGTLTGELRGVPVEVRFTIAYYDYRMQLRARAAKDRVADARQRLTPAVVRFHDGWLEVEPTGTKIKAGRYWHWALADPAELGRWLRDLAAVARE